MFGQATYLVWLLLFIGVPVAVMSWRWRAIIGWQWRALGWVTLGALIGGWVWDALSVRLGVWHYDAQHIVDIWFLGLPLEEWLWVAGISLMFGMVTIILKERAREP